MMTNSIIKNDQVKKETFKFGAFHKYSLLSFGRMLQK